VIKKGLPRRAEGVEKVTPRIEKLASESQTELCLKENGVGGKSWTGVGNYNLRIFRRPKVRKLR